MTSDHQRAAATSGWARRRWWIAGATAGGFLIWGLGSILLHTVLLGVLYFATPTTADRGVAADGNLDMTISPGHVETIVAEIREQQKQEFTHKVAELASVKHQLDELETKKVEQYNALMQEAAKQAPRLAKEAADQARASQEAALESQTAAQAALAKMNEAQAKVAAAQTDEEKAAARDEYSNVTKAAEAAQAAVSQAQKVVAAAQAKLALQVNMFGGNMADASQAAQAATVTQEEAERKQNAASDNRENLPHQQQRIEQLTADIERARSADATAKQRVEAVEKHLAELQPPPPTPPPAAEGSPTVAPDPVTSPPLIAAETPAATPSPTPLSKQAKQEIERVTRDLHSATNNEAQAATRLANNEQKLTAFKTETVQRFVKLQDDETEARQQQQTALDAQTKASQQIAAALAAPGLVPPDAAPSASPPPSAPGDADLAQLFNQARQMETAVADSYRSVRATELAAIRKIPLPQALALTEVAKPVRSEIDTAILTKDIRDVQGVREQEKTIQAASDQMTSMVALAERMKALAQPAGQAAYTVDTMTAMAAHSEHMEELASEYEDTRAKDLTDAMQEMESPADGADGSGGGGGGGGDGGEAMARLTAALADAMAKFALNPFDAKAMLEYQRLLVAVNALAAGRGMGRGGHGIPPVDRQRYKPVPGRTISHSMLANPAGRDSAWMFVDSWYIIGPWPNPRRKNLNTKFPPESVVDLDATYTGGRQNEEPLPVRWLFHQETAVQKTGGNNELTGMVVPPGLGEYEIYYAYTELWLDDAADLWVAIGSDDQSKIWLNDQMIWKSADYLKGWAANEGLRKVHFSKGINRILYRLENGRSIGGFSFMVCLDPNAPPPPEAMKSASVTR